MNCPGPRSSGRIGCKAHRASGEAGYTGYTVTMYALNCGKLSPSQQQTRGCIMCIYICKVHTYLDIHIVGGLSFKMNPPIIRTYTNQIQQAQSLVDIWLLTSQGARSMFRKTHLPKSGMPLWSTNLSRKNSPENLDVDNKD